MHGTLRAFALISVCAVALPTSSQAPPPMTPALALGTLAASEAGWDADDEVLALHHVLLRGAERATRRAPTPASYVAFARRYAPRLLGGRGQIQREWVRGLTPEGDEPPLWGFRRRRDGALTRVDCPPWRAYRDRWLALYAHAQRIVREHRLSDADEWSPCDEPPDHWGCPDCGDRERAEARGFIRVDCGPTDNDFWRVP